MFGVVKPDKIKRSGHFVMPFVSTGIVGVRVGLAGGGGSLSSGTVWVK